MGLQSAAFMHGEGEAWLRRNIDKLGKGSDPVLSLMKKAKLKPKNVLEVGCANGWRLREIEKKYCCEIVGVDPAAHNSRALWVGTASDLSHYTNRGEFDLVIYGFCLYACDREDLFKIASEGDRALKNGGHIIVYDFFARKPKKKPYKHKEGLFSYHYDYSKLWTWNPAYIPRLRQISKLDDGTIVETVLIRKHEQRAWPAR